MAGGFSMVPPAPWSKDVFSGRAGGRQGSYARQALGGRQSDAGKSREKALGYMKPVWSVGQSGQARIKSGGPGLILGRPPSPALMEMTRTWESLPEPHKARKSV